MATQEERVAEVRSVNAQGTSVTTTVPARLAEQVDLGHGDRLLWDYDPEADEIRVRPLD
jgi:bifunctional DNA-binding transcriptional regulator/antitoxin component of YhaV-PrlF toxin-antitoxin module